MRRRDEGLESSGRNASEKKEGKAGRLVERLLSWKEDLGALAALRRGWGKEPGTAPEMFPYVASFDDSRWEGEVIYIVAGLFGMWPQHDPSSGSFGASMRNIADGYAKMARGILPVLDTVLPIERFEDGLARLESRRVFGKIVVTL